MCMVLMFSTSANAGSSLGNYLSAVSGNKLVDFWGEAKKDGEGKKCEAVKAGVYWGYILGIAEAFNLTVFELPDPTETKQLSAVVGKWLENHPEEWNKPAIELVIKALQTAFPLKKK